jgi:hypothetical protein
MRRSSYALLTKPVVCRLSELYRYRLVSTPASRSKAWFPTAPVYVAVLVETSAYDSWRWSSPTGTRSNPVSGLVNWPCQ